MSGYPAQEKSPISGHGYEEASVKSKILSQREQEKKIAEDKRLREERDRKI